MYPPAIIVHGLDHAEAALRPGRPATLLSAPGAGIYAGVGWWQALVRAALHAYPAALVIDMLDCADSPGRALEALRAGQRIIVLACREKLQSDIMERAGGLGAIVLATPPPALDLADRRAARRLTDWLG